MYCICANHIYIIQILISGCVFSGRASHASLKKVDVAEPIQPISGTWGMGLTLWLFNIAMENGPFIDG